MRQYDVKVKKKTRFRWCVYSATKDALLAKNSPKLLLKVFFVTLPSKMANFFALLKETSPSRQKKETSFFVLLSTFRNFAGKTITT